MQNSEQTDERPIVVCVHGSASTGGQWRSFRQALRGRCRVFTPDLIGYGSRRFRPDGNYSLQSEVDTIVEQTGDLTEPFHLIGHSFGGAVAICFAQRYPERVKSLILYEPTNFAMLFAEGTDSEASLEISRVSAAFADGARTAFSRWRAARRFINYWSGDKAWSKLRFSQRSWIASKTPKVAAEFNAVVDAANGIADVRDLAMPVRILCGTQTTLAAKRCCKLMAAEIEDVRLLQLVNLQHMAPLTQPHSVNPLLVDYVLPAAEASAASASRRRA